ncbi:MAG TPA: peptidylprolyl isomerase [Candidatus Sulfobium mesophilum]|nr:peptidylprolyl isomerase [Candidatus Sulfobium mesophilum]
MKRIFMSILCAGMLFSCTQKAAEQTTQQGPVVAKVGTSGITQADFEREMKSLPDYAQQLFVGEAGKEKFLEEIIKKEILYQEALKKGLDKSPEFNRKLEEFKKLTLASALLEKEIMSKNKVSEQEVKDYYSKHKEDFTTTSQIRASHILVKTEAEANKVLERLKKGEKFEEIAKKESLDKGSAQNGGDVGYFSRGQMVPEFERAAASLKVGQLSGPVKTSYGYHIIKVTDKKTGPVVEFERVKDVIFQRLSGERQKEAFDKYIAELRKKKDYEVVINKDVLAKISPEIKKTEKPEAAPDKPSEEVQKKDEKKK